MLTFTLYSILNLSGPCFVICVQCFVIFLLQFSVKLGFRKIPITHVDHHLDDSVPFDPTKVHVYLDFVNFWIRPMSFMLKRFGVKKRYPTVPPIFTLLNVVILRRLVCIVLECQRRIALLRMGEKAFV